MEGGFVMSAHQAIPRILIAGAHSGCGKTTLTVGLVAALRRRGLKVQTFKVGPDYLDPTWLASASGRPCYNLDGWMCGRAYVENLFARVTRDADVAVIEGVMGLFDGAQASGLAGSTAEIAQWLQTPVVLTVNAHGMGRSIAPVIAGFAGFADGVRVRGVIANQCGSESHGALLDEALTAAGLPGLVGAVPRLGFPELRSRHLGLVTADPAANCPASFLEAFEHAAASHLNLNALLRLAREASPLPVPEKGGAGPGEPQKRETVRFHLAVARDEAFHFYYPDLFDELEARGARITFFSPLHDAALPSDTDALYLGGGYPEEFAAALSAHASMLASIRSFAQSGRVVYAECGGLIYLSQAVTVRDGPRYPLLGILPAETRMTGRRVRLGYTEVTLNADSLWGASGTVLRGHEFHYGELVSDPAQCPGWTAVYERRRQNGKRETDEGFHLQNSSILVSFVHLHLASRPAVLDRFVQLCANAN